MITRTDTGAYTGTHTFTQTEVVVNQYKIAIRYAGVLSEERTEQLLEAVRKQQISSIGIYACNSESKRVAEVEIKVDWDKHQQIISTYGDIFDEGQTGFNYNNGEAGETKVFVNNLVKRAKKKGYKLSIWVRVSDSINGEDMTQILKKIGFGGGGSVEPWSGNIKEETSHNYKTIPQMKIGYKASEQI